MSNETFSKTIASIKRISDWYDVFPPEVDFKRTKHYARQCGVYYPPDMFEKEQAFLWLGVLDIVERLQHPQLCVARLYREIRRFERDIINTDQGLLRYGKYSKADRMSERPQKDYNDAVRRFLASVKRATSTADLRGLEHELRYNGARQLCVEKRDDREHIQKFILKLLRWVKEKRRKGRPVDDGSILLYHLVNSLTNWKLTKNGKPRKDKKGRIKVKRRWDDIARVLLWLHYKKLRIPWLAAFIKHNASKDATRAMTDMKKLMRSRYSHLSRYANPGQSHEGAFSPIGLLRVVSLNDHLKAYPL